MNKKNWVLFFICLGLFTLNFILKVFYISYSDIGLDEPFTIYFSQRNISGIMEMLKNENNPPLHFIFMHFWIKFFGVSAFSVRFPSVLFSCLSVIFIFLIGERYFSKLTGLVASLLFTGSTLHMYYAHDARVYTMFVLLTCCSLFYFLKIISTDNITNKRTLFALTSINILLCYSHFFGFIVIFTEVLICLIRLPLRKYLLQLFLSSGVVILSYAWYLPIVLERLKISSGGTWISKPLLTDLYTMLWRFSNVPVLTVILLCILFYSIFFKWKQINTASGNIFKTLILFFSFCYFGLFFVSLKLPVFIDRYLLFTSVFYYLLIGVSTSFLIRSEKWYYLISLVPIIFMFATLDLKKGKKAEIKDLVDYIKTNYKQPVNILITPDWYDLNFTYYYNQKWFCYTEHLRDTLNSYFIFTDNLPNDISFNSNKPLILIDNNSGNFSLQKSLNEKFQLRSEKDFNGGLKLEYFDSRKNN